MANELNYYLWSDELSKNILTTKFNRNYILNAIIEHLNSYPTDTIELRKDWDTEKLDKKYLGKEVLDLYEVNPNNGKPSKIQETYLYDEGFVKRWIAI